MILFILVAVATPNAGVVSVGDVANTKRPVPCLSPIMPMSSSDDVWANCESFPAVVARPVMLPPRETAVVLMVIAEEAREVFGIAEIVLFAALIVLFVSVSLPANVASVPAVGKVTVVVPVDVKVVTYPPDVASVPPSAIVIVALDAG